MAHMVWGKGGLLNAFLGGKIPCFDFAGGTVVHITSGVSALVCALYLGKRIGYPERSDEAAQPGAQLHRRLPAVGGLVRLQCRQRAGSVGSLATSAFVATHFGAAAGALGWVAGGVDASTASPACWAGSRELWPAWSRLLRLPVS